MYWDTRSASEIVPALPPRKQTRNALAQETTYRNSAARQDGVDRNQQLPR